MANKIKVIPQQTSESAIRRVIKNDVTLVITIGGFIFSFIMFVVRPQMETAKDIALIQQSIDNINTNHLTHLQDYTAEVKALQEEQTEQSKIQTELMKEITTISTRLEDHITDTK